MRQDTRKKLMEKTTGQFLYFGLPIVPQEQLNLLIINDNTSNQALVQQTFYESLFLLVPQTLEHLQGFLRS